MKQNLYCMHRRILYADLKPLFNAIDSIDYAVIKGEALSQQIYKQLDKRVSSDIDILVSKKNVHLVEQELKKIGYSQHAQGNLVENRFNRVLCMTHSHQIPSYYKTKLGFNFNVDVNFDIYWGEYEDWRYPIDEFIKETIYTNIYGVAVKTLPVDKAFVQLVLHHYKEMNSIFLLSRYNTISMRVFDDIYHMLVNNQEDLSTEKLEKLCEVYSIGKYMYYVLYYCSLIYNSSVLLTHLNSLSQYRDEELLASYGLAAHERKKWKCTFSERLDNDDLCEDLTTTFSPEDIEKISRNSRIFL